MPVEYPSRLEWLNAGVFVRDHKENSVIAEHEEGDRIEDTFISRKNHNYVPG